MFTYHFHTRICDWWISYRPELGRWLLSWGDVPGSEISGSYGNPVAAASDVDSQVTGNYDWDSLPYEAIPPNISNIREWVKCPPR